MTRRPPLRCLRTLTALVVMALASPALGAGKQTVLAEDFTFSGRVYLGYVGDTGTLLPGAGVALYGSNNAAQDPGTFIREVTTNRSGAYSLTITSGEPGFEFYNIRETDPADVISDGAQSVGGTVVHANWIQYGLPLAGKIGSDNNFWDRPEKPFTPTPTTTSTPTVPIPTPTPGNTATPTAIPTRTPRPTNTATPASTSTPTPTRTPTQTTTTLVLCAVADASVSQASPDETDGAGQVLRVEYGLHGEPLARRILARFDTALVPPGATVVSAHLRIGLADAVGLSPVDVSVFEVRQSWNEATVTWANQPGIATSEVTRVPVSTAFPTLVSWNVTALARGWVSGSVANRGVELRGPETGAGWARAFESREAGFCPRLEITVRSAGPIPTPTPTLPPTPTPTRTPTLPPSCPGTDAGNTFATARSIVAGAPTPEYICPSGDSDYWQLDVEHGQEIGVSLSGMTADYDIYLLNPSGGVEASSELWGAGKNEWIHRTAWTAGAWRVLVTGKGVADWSKTKPYSLLVNVETVCYEPDEAGNTFASAAPIQPSLPQVGTQNVVHGIICPAFDDDFYRFDVPGGQNVGIQAVLSGLTADYSIGLLTPQGVIVGTHVPGSQSDTVTFTAHSQPGAWRVWVQGDHPGHTYDLEVRLTAQTDLTVRGIEVTQAIQTATNSIPMIVGKPTWARVFLDIGSVLGPIPGVSIDLYGWSIDGWGAVHPLPGPIRVGPEQVFAPSGPLFNTQRSMTEAFGAIPLPASWHLPGATLRLKAVVNPDHTVPETSVANNELTVHAAGFTLRRALNVFIAPVRAAGVVPAIAGNPHFDNMVKYFAATYPTSGINLFYKIGDPVPGDFDYTFPEGGGCGDGWGELLNKLKRLWWINVWGGGTWFPLDAGIYGVLDTSPSGQSGDGCGSYDLPVAAGFVGPLSVDTLAHERGHNFGRKHAPCGDVKNVDGGFPTYPNPQGGNYASASIGEVGFNPFTRARYDPSTARDFMSYCTSWVSPYTYLALMQKIPFTAPFHRMATSASYLMVSGSVADEQVDLDLPFSVQSGPAGLYGQPGVGPWSIELQDRWGVPLFTRSFDPDADCGDPGHQCGVFAQVLPFPSGVVRLVVRHGTAPARVLDVTPRVPTVTVASPAGGSWPDSGPVTVAWQAADPDGDPVSADVLYSPDNGASWLGVATGVTEQSVTFDVSRLPGGEKTRVKVQVSDGINTTSDLSDTEVRVGRKRASVVVVEPMAGAVLEARAPLAVMALAIDPEDGTLSGEAVAWSSDRDGSLGRGSALALAGLSCGEHILTARATDSNGQTGEANVGVTACCVEVASSTLTVRPAGGALGVEVRAPAGCPWQVRSAATWISVVGNPSGTGWGMLRLQVSPGPADVLRAATVEIGDQVVEVVQSGPSPRVRRHLH